MRHPLRLFLALLVGLCLPWLAMPAAAQAPEIDSDAIEYIHLHASELPSVNLSSDLLYRILAAEIAAQRGQLDVASHGFLALARDTSDPRFARMAFRAAVVQRDQALAAQAAQQWVELAPEDPEAIASNLAMAASNGEVAGLAEALRERIAQADNKTNAVVQATSIVAKLDDSQRALEVLEAAFSEETLQLPIARLALSDVAWAAEDRQRAVQEALNALDLQPDYESAALRALEYGAAVDHEAAMARARTFIEQNPDAHKLPLLLANHLVRVGQFEEALALLGDMRTRTPEDFDLLYTEAEINARAGRYTRAKRLLEEYISVQDQRRDAIDDQATNAMADASDARLLLVQIAEQENDLNEAIRQLDRIDDPSVLFQAQVHKAVLQSRQGLLSEARDTLDKLSAQDDREHAVKALTLASIYRESGRTDKAIETLRDADRRIPDVPEIKYDLGMLYERQGQFDDFEAKMLEVIELEPNNANAYNSLGYTLVDRNTRLDEAREFLFRALELDPESPYILDSVGWYYYRLQDYEEALAYLQRSYDLLKSGEVGAHLGEVLWKLGRQQEARRVWKDAYQHEPDNAVLLETMQLYEVKP